MSIFTKPPAKPKKPDWMKAEESARREKLIENLPERICKNIGEIIILLIWVIFCCIKGLFSGFFKECGNFNRFVATDRKAWYDSMWIADMIEDEENQKRQEEEIIELWENQRR